MEKMKGLKLTGNETGVQHSTFAGLKSAINTDLVDRKAKVVEEQQEPLAYQGSKSPQNHGKIRKFSAVWI